MARSDRPLQRHQHGTLQQALGPQALSRRRTSSPKTPSEQEPDHCEHPCHEDQLHFLNKTTLSQGFNLAPYLGNGHHQLVQIQVRARQVTLQHFSAEVTNQSRHKGISLASSNPLLATSHPTSSLLSEAKQTNPIDPKDKTETSTPCDQANLHDEAYIQGLSPLARSIQVPLGHLVVVWCVGFGG